MHFSRPLFSYAVLSCLGCLGFLSIASPVQARSPIPVSLDPSISCLEKPQFIRAIRALAVDRDFPVLETRVKELHAAVELCTLPDLYKPWYQSLKTYQNLEIGETRQKMAAALLTSGIWNTLCRMDSPPIDAIHRTTTADIRPESVACLLTGILLQKESRAPEAISVLQKSCDLGLQRGCTQLGAAYYQGTGIEKSQANQQKAFEIFQKTCAANEQSGCNNVAIYYHTGTIVQQDTHKALDMYQKVCQQGEPAGCYNAGRIYDHTATESISEANSRMANGKLNPNYIPQDYKKAAEVYQQGCSIGLSLACANAGDIYKGDWLGTAITPEEQQKNQERAKAFYTRACFYGDADSCMDAASL